MTFPPLSVDEVFDTSPRLPGEYVPEFDAERILATYRTATTLRTMRDETPRIAERRGLTAVALDALILWLEWTFGEDVT